MCILSVFGAGRMFEWGGGDAHETSKKIQNYTPQHDIGGLHISGGKCLEKLFHTVFGVRDGNACPSRFM